MDATQASEIAETWPIRIRGLVSACNLPDETAIPIVCGELHRFQSELKSVAPIIAASEADFCRATGGSHDTVSAGRYYGSTGHTLAMELVEQVIRTAWLAKQVSTRSSTFENLHSGWLESFDPDWCVNHWETVKRMLVEGGFDFEPGHVTVRIRRERLLAFGQNGQSRLSEKKPVAQSGHVLDEESQAAWESYKKERKLEPNLSIPRFVEEYDMRTVSIGRATMIKKLREHRRREEGKTDKGDCP